MKILTVEHSFPETAYSNAAVIDRVTASSRDFLSFDDLVHSVGFLEQMFQTSGSENRYLGDGRERPIDLVVEASRRALATAGVGPKDLDFVIFGGVTRGFLVPSSASAVQHALGASGASCFDVLDACASWLRALQTADGLFHTGASKVGLIVNCECGNFDDRRIWEIRSLGELEQRGGTYTLGEAATATVVSHTNARSPSSYYSYSFGEFGDLAVFPLRNMTLYSQLANRAPECMLFHSRSQELSTTGFRLWMDCVRNDDPLKGMSVDVAVLHAGSARMVDVVMGTGKISASCVVNTFPKYGNTIAATIPLGLSIASKDGLLNRGDQVFVGAVAAGISIVGAQFEY